MSIKDFGEKIKDLREGPKNWLKGLIAEEDTSRYYIGVVIVLVGLSSFGLGRLSAIDDARESVVIEDMSGNEVQGAPMAIGVATPSNSSSQTASVVSSVASEPLPASGKLVASKNGTKYYFPWCASNIAEKNKIWFNSEAEARARGLLPAANCKGLK